jgi:hypothetical protein
VYDVSSIACVAAVVCDVCACVWVTEDDQTSGRRAGQAATGATAAGASRLQTTRAISVAWQLSVALTLAASATSCLARLPHLPRRAWLICISTSSTPAAFVPGFHWAIFSAVVVVRVHQLIWHLVFLAQLSKLCALASCKVV